MSELTLKDTDSDDWSGLRDEILELKAKGCTVEYIARAKGCSVKKVTRILKSEFQERFNNRQAIVEAHSIELEWLKKKVLDRLYSSPTFDRRDAELYLKIRAEIARLFGSDAPQQHQHQVTHDFAELADDEVIAQLKQFGVQVPAGFLSLPPAPDTIDADFTVAEENVEQQNRSS